MAMPPPLPTSVVPRVARPSTPASLPECAPIGGLGEAPRKRGVDLRLGLSLGLFVAAIGLSAYLLWLDPHAHASTRVETRVLGATVASEGDPWPLCNELARRYLREPLTLRLGKRTHQRSRGALGARVELTALSQLLRAVADPSSPLRRLHAQQRGEDAALDLPLPAHLEGPAAEQWLRALAARFDEPARPLRVDPNTGALRRARNGRRLDVHATLDALDQAIFRGRGTVDAKVVTLTPTTAWTPAGPVDVSTTLGSFESSAAEADRARIANLAGVARRLDGTLLGPGEVFDLRALLGETRGLPPFRTGKVSERDGDPLDAALSQVASTLYAAALFAGLPILEQQPVARPTRELPLGLDAAFDAQHNLRFQNDLTVPIALGVSASGGNVRAFVRGPRPASSAAREVDIELSVEDITPYPEQARVDPSLPEGVRVTARRGLPGLRVLLKRSVHLPDEQPDAAEERSAYYPPSPRLTRVGTGKIALEELTAQAGDPRAELMVDEFLALSMRPGFALPEVATRRPGRTSEPDWTATAGP
jgi:vancomycin resistance protein YoaR